MVLDECVSVTFILDNFKVYRCVALMSGTKLMMTDNIVVGDFPPLRGANMMLCMDKWITNKADMAHDINKLVGGHAVPFVAVDFGVVNL